jgi:hypothetical protein
VKWDRFLHREEKGVALITVVLVTALVVGLIVMALTNGMIGRVLTQTYRTERTFLQCSQGDLELANRLLVMGIEGTLVPGQFGDVQVASQNMNDIVNTVIVVDNSTVNGPPGPVFDFIEELHKDGTPVEQAALSADTVLNPAPGANTPDIVIRKIETPNCTTNIDIDYLFRKVDSSGYALDEGLMSTGQLGGATCAHGDIFSVVAVTRNNATGAQSVVRSAFCHPT